MSGRGIFQVLLALIGVALTVSSLAYLQENLLSGLLGTLGGVLIVLGSILTFSREKRKATRP